MPPDDGLRLDEDEAGTPVRPEPRQASPEESIATAEPGSIDTSLQNGELLPEGEIFESQLRTVREEGAEDQENDSEDGHRDLPGRTLLAA